MDLGLLHLVVERLLQVELVAVGELVEVELEPLLVHGALHYLFVWEVLIWGWNGVLCACMVSNPGLLNLKKYIDRLGMEDTPNPMKCIRLSISKSR